MNYELQDKILEVLDDSLKPLPATKVAELTGCYRKTASKELAILADLDLVVHNGEQGRASGWSRVHDEIESFDDVEVYAFNVADFVEPCEAPWWRRDRVWWRCTICNKRKNAYKIDAHVQKHLGAL